MVSSQRTPLWTGAAFVRPELGGDSLRRHDSLGQGVEF